MIPICGNVAALAVAVIFYTWRSFMQLRDRKHRVLCDRVTYMLWRAADVSEEPVERLSAEIA
jgi:hypothetical protein